MLLRNVSTGQEVSFSDDPVARSRYRFGRACRALDRWAEEVGAVRYFVTLTLRDEETGAANAQLHKFLAFLGQRFKRAGQEWKYVWAVELQRRRYRRTGVAALHWHFVIACPAGALPNVQYVKSAHYHYRVLSDGDTIGWRALLDGWGRGQVFSMLAYSKHVYRYIGKYLEKDYGSIEGYRPEWGKLRRFGSSQFGALAYPAWALEAVAEKEAANEDLGDLARRRIGGAVHWGANLASGKGFVSVAAVRSPWRQVVATKTFDELWLESHPEEVSH